jgi:hypothetical protein
MNAILPLDVPCSDFDEDDIEVLPPVDGFHDPHWQDAARWFIDRLDEEMRRQRRDRLLPWEKPVGIINWWRIHAYALDRIDEILPLALPDGDLTEEDDWRGRHDEGAPWFIVNRLTGTWSEPASGGSDLAGLIAAIYGISMRRAAIKLASQLGIEGVRHG